MKRKIEEEQNLSKKGIQLNDLSIGDLPKEKRASVWLRKSLIIYTFSIYLIGLGSGIFYIHTAGAIVAGTLFISGGVIALLLSGINEWRIR